LVGKNSKLKVVIFISLIETAKGEQRCHRESSLYILFESFNSYKER
jgi:hypothetical protein